MASLLATVTVAKRVPGALGSKRTRKIVLAPAARVVGGSAVTVKFAASGPLILTCGEPKARVPVPLFWIVKVCVTVPPVMSALSKSVLVAIEGVDSPSGMGVALPTISIAGAVVPVP